MKRYAMNEVTVALDLYIYSQENMNMEDFHVVHA